MHTKKTATAAERAIVSFIKESQCKDRFDITNVLEILILQASRSIEPLINLYNKITTQHKIPIDMRVSLIGRREYVNVFDVDRVRFEIDDNGSAVCNSDVNFSKLHLRKVQQAIDVFITTQLRDWKLQNGETEVVD